MPTVDIAALAQRVFAFLQRVVIGGIGVAILNTLINLISKPLILGAVVAIFTYCPDVVKWIFMQIGGIMLSIFGVVLGLFMPSIMGEMGEGSTDVVNMSNNALSALPADVIEVFTSFGISELLGMVVSVLLLGWIIRIYRRAMMRAGLS